MGKFLSSFLKSKKKKKRRNLFLHKIKNFSRSYHGRNFLSRHVRVFFENFSVREIVGPGLIIAVFSFSVLAPQTRAYVETVQTISYPVNNTLNVVTTTEPNFRYPLEKFQITQGFSLFHWGIDLSAPQGTPIFPIAAGKVIELRQSSWGFGNYLIVDHQNSQKSLYAHLTKINVKIGDKVNKETIIGFVGHSGWATGDHLHLEIYQNGLPLNPLEAFPEK